MGSFEKIIQYEEVLPLFTNKNRFNFFAYCLPLHLFQLRSFRQEETRQHFQGQTGDAETVAQDEARAQGTHILCKYHQIWSQ